MTLLRRLALAVAMTTMSAGLVTTATTAPAAAQAGQTLGTCVYWVLYNGVPVHENPDTDSVVRKWKNYGDRVEGPCQSVYDAESGLFFNAVFCSCATDNIGWMSSRRLTQV